MDEQVQQQIQHHRPFGEQICDAMFVAIQKLGFSDDEVTAFKPEFDAAEFSLSKDPYTASENLTGNWFDHKHQRIGNIQFLSDGSFFAEFDIVKPHPSKKQWFIEGMNAWGREGQIKTEAKLLPAL